MDDITQWLASGKDYAEGVRIFGRHSKNAALVRHFQCTTAKFAAAKLEYELRKLLKGRAITSHPVKTTAQTVITTPKPKQPTALPDTIAQVKNELYELFTAISTATSRKTKTLSKTTAAFLFFSQSFSTITSLRPAVSAPLSYRPFFRGKPAVRYYAAISVPRICVLNLITE